MKHGMVVGRHSEPPFCFCSDRKTCTPAFTPRQLGRPFFDVFLLLLWREKRDSQQKHIKTRMQARNSTKKYRATRIKNMKSKTNDQTCDAKVVPHKGFWVWPKIYYHHRSLSDGPGMDCGNRNFVILCLQFAPYEYLVLTCQESNIQ